MNFECRSLTHTMLSMWGKIMIPINLQARNILFGEWIPMYRLWLHGLYGLYRLRCLLSPERPLNLITHSLLLFIPVPSLIIVGSIDVPSHNGRRLSHDDVIKWKPLPGHWPFVRGIHRWPFLTQCDCVEASETFSKLLAICAGNPPVTGGFPPQRPVTQSFDDFFDLRLNKRRSKQSRRRWFETPSRSLWRHRNTAGTVLTTKLIMCVQIVSRGPWYWHGITLIPARVSNHMSNKVWDELT